jgi:hypothetical protein
MKTNPNTIIEVYGSTKKPDGTRTALIKTAGGRAFWVLPAEVNGEMPRVGTLIDPSKHEERTTHATDMRMTWCQAAQIFIAVLQDGTPKGKQEATVELMKMARAADVAKGAAELIDRFLGIDDWSDESIAPAALIKDARELMQQVWRAS